MIILIFISCHYGDVCPHETAPPIVPVGNEVELTPGVSNPTLTNPTLTQPATASITEEQIVITYTDENGRTWHITYEIGKVISWFHDGM